MPTLLGWAIPEQHFMQEGSTEMFGRQEGSCVLMRASGLVQTGCCVYKPVFPVSVCRCLP